MCEICTVGDGADGFLLNFCGYQNVRVASTA